MATNQHINKVVVNNSVILDLSEDTVTADSLSKGVTAHDKSGQQIVGTKEVAEIITYPEVPFTCTEDGMSEGIYCSCCKTWIKKREVIFAHHVDENGDNICDVCGEVLLVTIASGDCGTDLTWDLKSDYTIHISGTSEMTDFSGGSATPWSAYSEKIKKVKIVGGKTIGDYAFSNCSSLETVDFGSQITKIGKYAFNKCTSLTTLEFPPTLTLFGLSTFYYCSNFCVADFSKHTEIPTLSSQYVFQGTSSNLVIKVPSSLLEQWKAATNWVKYADSIVGV